MEKQSYNYVLAIAMLAIVGVGAYALGTQTVMPSLSGEVQHMGYTGMVCHEVIRVDGTKEDIGCNHNLLFLNGKNYTTSQLFNTPTASSATIFDVVNISLGNGTVVPSHASTIANFGGIADCGLAPVTSKTWISIQNSSSGYIDASGNVSTNNLWTATCGSGTGLEVNQTAIGNESTVGVSTATPWFAANTFTNVFLQSGDQLNVTWYVWIT